MKKSTKFLALALALNLMVPTAFADGDGLFDVPVTSEETADQGKENPAPAEENPLDPAPQTNTPAPAAEPEIPAEVPKPATTSSEGKRVSMILGKSVALVNGKEVKLGAPAEAMNGRTYLPLRFLSEEILGTSPNYDSKTKQISIKTESASAVLTLNKKEAILNGKKTVLETPPITKNGTTLLPLKFFTDNFGLGVSFDPVKKEVVVKDKIQDLNPPVADFAFSMAQYTQGQKIEFTDKSTDADNDQIINREWYISNNPSLKNSDINKLVENLPPGEYTAYYRVQSSKKAWSEWTSKPFVYLKNEPPTATDIRLTKSDIGRGEEFDIIYTQHNEPWEMITEAIWTYRYETIDASKAITAKPTKLFTSGKYIATLQLKDAYGNLSEVYEIDINVGSRIVQTQMDYLANGAGKVNTPLENFNNANFLEHFSNMGTPVYTDTPGLLIMSDSPENVFDYGILYQDTITAQKGRLLTYHVNKIPAPKSSGAGIIVVVENIDAIPVTFSLEKTGMKGPSTDPLEVGGKVLETHFAANSPWTTATINPGQSKIIYDSRPSSNWKSNQLLSMLSEFDVTGTVKISVIAVGPTTKLEHIPTLSYLAKDQHPRGTFPVIERSATIDIPGKEPSGILIGKDASEWVVGTDGITGETVQNRGNYGVEYKLTLNPKEDTLIFVNCRGGAFRGHVGWPDGVNRTVSSYGPHDARFIGRIKGGESTTIRYMLANASASPVKIGFMPESSWSKSF